MGLDAVVYRNREHLELGRDEEHAKVIPQSGEVYFEDDKLARKRDHRREAVAHRLGNISAIAELRDEVARVIGPQSMTIQKILYSGTHSGDAIPLRELPELSAELQAIRQSGRGSARLHQFVGALEKLIQAANEEGNPVVFV
jgi:hypothetical protein